MDERYREWLEGAVRLRDEEWIRVPKHWGELEVQARWFAGEFGREFRSAEGCRIRIAQFGIWNREAGPDFVDAAVEVEGGEAARGSIEIDRDPRDWERHGHATNPAYDAVVLHVCWQRGGPTFFTRTLSHREVPRIEIDPDACDVADPAPNSLPGRCRPVFEAMGAEKGAAFVEMAARYRMRKKGERLAALAELHGADEAFYQAIADAFGYKSNRIPFRVLAQRLPLAVLRQQRDDAEALLFGVAGFLDAPDLSAYGGDTRTRLRDLWERWWRHRPNFAGLVLGRERWHLGGQRPMNHPQRRLAGLARLVKRWGELRMVARAFEPDEVHDFFRSVEDEYWSHHYTLESERAGKPMALIGASRVDDLLANVCFPLALREAPTRWGDFKKMRLPLSNRRVKIAVGRLFGEGVVGEELVGTAWGQQGLMQIEADFCARDFSGCQRCPMPGLLARER
jgi:hypothetical protein